MFYKRRDQLKRWIFSRQIRHVSGTQPVRLSDDESAPFVLSQLQHKDVLMYMAAIKSFARHLIPREVHVVDDGSLTRMDHELLEKHIPGVQIHNLATCRVPGLPHGGTWERLILIARLSQTHYVIQLDSDTLTLKSIDEVVTAAKKGRSFSIGTWDGQEIESVFDRASKAQLLLNNGIPHIQVLAESNLDRLRDAQNLRYVRGCSGFAGFSVNASKLDFMRLVSAQMSSIIGKRWSEWGSEQFMSNLMVANQPDAFVLPHPEYSDCEKLQSPVTRFVHFIGTCRFRSGRYANLVHGVVSELAKDNEKIS